MEMDPMRMDPCNYQPYNLSYLFGGWTGSKFIGYERHRYGNYKSGNRSSLYSGYK